MRATERIVSREFTRLFWDVYNNGTLIINITWPTPTFEIHKSKINDSKKKKQYSYENIGEYTDKIESLEYTMNN